MELNRISLWSLICPVIMKGQDNPPLWICFDSLLLASAVCSSCWRTGAFVLKDHSEVAEGIWDHILIWIDLWGFFSFCTKIRSDCLVLDWWWVSKKTEQGSLLSTLALLNRWPFSTCSAIRLTHISDCPTEHSGLQVKLRNLPPFSTDSHSCPAYTDKVFLRFSYWRYTQTLHLHNKPPTWTHNKVLINSSGCEKNHLYP